MLEVEIVSQGQTERQTIPIEGKLYPTSVIGIYPVLHGLELGRRYSYKVYDGETQSIATVTQKILAYEESDLLFSGKAFKIKTELLGQKVTSWIGLDGKPLLEIAPVVCHIRVKHFRPPHRSFGPTQISVASTQL